MADLVVTPELMESAGDVLLEIIVRGGTLAHPRDSSVLPGDLVVETSKFALDWERVGYLLSVTEEPYPPGVARDPAATEKVFRVWTIARRIVTWRNAEFRRIDFWRGTGDLRSFPRPTPEDLAADPDSKERR